MNDREHFSGKRAFCTTVAVAFFAAAAVSACTQTEPNKTTVIYTTEYGLGPDKWATAWLLTRRADPKARLVVSDAGAPPGEGVPFDLPSSAIRRMGNRSAFEVAKGKLAINDPVVDELANIVYEIEVNFWTAGGPPEADTVEEAYRALQYRHGRDAITPQCYVAFFDRVYQMLRDAKLNSIPFVG